MKNKVAYIGIFVALALIFSYVETLIPVHIGIPGVKLGLANLIIVIVLYKFKVKEAFFLSVCRILLSGFMFGNLFSILYSLSGGLFSFAAMVFLKRKGSYSVMGVSIAGGVCHNIGQLLIAVVLLETGSLLYYVPVLLISGLLTGWLIGLLAHEMLKRIPFHMN